jgi:reactive chlorine resistance protein C
MCVQHTRYGVVSEIIERRIRRVGGGVLRWSLVLFFVGWGLYKFTPQEAAGVAPLMAHSPVLFWVTPLLGVRGGSDLIGVIEILMGASIALRHVNPLWSAYGSLATSGALLITMSFLFTTPGLDPQSIDAGFLAKDLTLFGAALWTSGEAFSAARKRPAGPEVAHAAPEVGR